MITISNSKAKTWRKCRNAYYYKYIEKIVPRRKAAPLVKGSIIHEMDEAWTNGGDWREVLKKYAKEYKKLFLEEQEEYGDIINDMEKVMLGYIAKWKGKDLTYIEKDGRATEHPIEVDLAPGIILTGYIDKIGVDQRNKVWLTEKKSFKRGLPKEDVRFTDLQTTIYYWAAPHCGFPQPHGIMWDYVRSKPPVVPELLKKGGLSKRKNIDTTYEVYLAAIKEHKFDPADYKEILDDLKHRPDSFYRRIYLPPPKSLVKSLLEDLKQTAREIEALGEVSRIRTITRDCGWCDYYSLCQAELRGLDTDFIRQKEYQERRDENESKEKVIEED